MLRLLIILLDAAAKAWLITLLICFALAAYSVYFEDSEKKTDDEVSEMQTSHIDTQ